MPLFFGVFGCCRCCCCSLATFLLAFWWRECGVYVIVLAHFCQHPFAAAFYVENPNFKATTRNALLLHCHMVFFLGLCSQFLRWISRNRDDQWIVLTFSMKKKKKKIWKMKLFLSMHKLVRVLDFPIPNFSIVILVFSFKKSHWITWTVKQKNVVNLLESIQWNQQLENIYMISLQFLVWCIFMVAALSQRFVQIFQMKMYGCCTVAAQAKVIPFSVIRSMLKS